MEALGVASSIAGLISLADVLAFKISKYYSLVKGAHSDIRDLLMEIQSLYGVLNSLKLLATCLEADKPPAYTGHLTTFLCIEVYEANFDCRNCSSPPVGPFSNVPAKS
jgi:hypothetical protein